MAQLTAPKYMHNAPAGSQYKSILEAGRTLLHEKYSNFMRGSTNALIPPILINDIPEEVDSEGHIVPGSDISTSDEKYLQGVKFRKLGEDLELRVFRRFE